jgi:hypothetical protein
MSMDRLLIAIFYVIKPISPGYRYPTLFTGAQQTVVLSYRALNQVRAGTNEYMLSKFSIFYIVPN